MIQSSDFTDFDALSDYDRPEETERRLLELAQIAKAATPRDPSYCIEVLAQIARMQGLQNKLPEAKNTLKESEEFLIEAEDTCRAAAKIRYFLENGRLCILDKTPSQARPLFIEAWTLANNSGEDFLAIDAAQMLAAIEPQKLQKEWILKAMAIAEASPQSRAKQTQGALYSTLGWTQFDVRQYEGALEFFKKALSFIKAHGTPRKVITAKWAVAKTLRSLNRIEEALELQKDLLAELARINVADGLVYEELAECLQSLKKTSEAQVYFDLAYNELKKDTWLSDNKPERLKRLKSLGKVK
jgi:tetratricopeptide (TPR) repeat protein